MIRPEKPLEVGRVEKDVDKLIDLYDQGWEEAKAKLDKLNF